MIERRFGRARSAPVLVPERETILARLQAAGIPYRSSVHGPVDSRIDTEHDGKIVYWNEPEGHQWEMLTVSYARQPA